MSKKWKARTSEPALTNKYYLKTTGGGYNQCILGNDSTNKQKNRQAKFSVLPNCVGYVYGRSLEIAGKTAMAMPTANAKEWYTLLNWEKSDVPMPGAIACWTGTYGHIAIVEEVNQDGSFTISESGWSSFYFRTNKIGANKYYASSLKFQGFLINPYASNNYEEVADTTTATKTSTATATSSSFLPKKGYFGYGDKDAKVGQIASFMYKTFPAYTKKAALGNYFGPNLKASIVEFQKRTGLEADGNVGPITLAKLQSFGFKY